MRQVTVTRLMAGPWVLLMLAVVAGVRLDSQMPADGRSFPDIIDHFRYGSIGTEERSVIGDR